MSTAEKTISFRADAEKIDTLDSLAAAQDRPRSYLINEAITSYRTRWFARGWKRCAKVASSAMRRS
jgi:predicted transcriptional regulator